MGNSSLTEVNYLRRKGFATEMLRQLLEVAKKAGMNELYLSVEKKNEPSVKTIIRNGGVYQRSFEMDGEQADIYRAEHRVAWRENDRIKKRKRKAFASSRGME